MAFSRLRRTNVVIGPEVPNRANGGSGALKKSWFLKLLLAKVRPDGRLSASGRPGKTKTLPRAERAPEQDRSCTKTDLEFLDTAWRFAVAVSSPLSGDVEARPSRSP
jgi:hypothetical protein